MVEVTESDQLSSRVYEYTCECGGAFLAERDSMYGYCPHCGEPIKRFIFEEDDTSYEEEARAAFDAAKEPLEGYGK